MLNANSRWKSITSVAELERFLVDHPDYFIYDSGDRENRYSLRRRMGKNRLSDGLSVDGRSVRAIRYKVEVRRA